MNPKIAVVERSKRNETFKRVSRIAEFDVVRTNPQGIGRSLAEGAELILVDMGMPEMEGIEVLRALKKAAKDAAIPVLVVSVGSVRSKKIKDTIQRFISRKTGEIGTLSTPEYQRGKWRSISIGEIAIGMGVPRTKLAQIIGISERNLARWVTGETKPKGIRDASLQRLKYIYFLLTRALKEEAIPRYLREPSLGLDGRTPLLALQAGDFNSVESDLQQLIEGVYV